MIGGHATLRQPIEVHIPRPGGSFSQIKKEGGRGQSRKRGPEQAQCTGIFMINSRALRNANTFRPLREGGLEADCKPGLLREQQRAVVARCHSAVVRGSGRQSSRSFGGLPSIEGVVASRSSRSGSRSRPVDEGEEVQEEAPSIPFP